MFKISFSIPATSVDATTNEQKTFVVNDQDRTASPTLATAAEDEANDTDQETDRLLDQMHIETDPTDANSSRRGSHFRVRTLSGTPLAIPHHHSPAILRHGVGTALSANAITFTDDGHVEENPTASPGEAKKRAMAAGGSRKGSAELRSDSYRVRKSIYIGICSKRNLL